jgi:hypothetical protein
MTVNIHYQETQRGEAPHPFQPEDDTAGEVVITLAELLEMGPEEAAAVLGKVVSPYAAQRALDYMASGEAAAILQAMDPRQAVPYLSVMTLQRAARALEEMDPDVARGFALGLGAERAGQVLSAMQEQSAIALTLAVDDYRKVADLLVAMNRDRGLAILDTMEIARRKDTIDHMTSMRALVLRTLAEKRLQVAEERLQEAEAEAAEIAARGAERAIAESRRRRARQYNEKRLMPLTWSVRASAWLFFLSTIPLYRPDYYAHWPVAIVVYGLAALATACGTMFIKVIRIGGAVISFASFCAAAVDSIFLANQKWPLYETIPILLLAWFIGFGGLVAASEDERQQPLIPR